MFHWWWLAILLVVIAVIWYIGYKFFNRYIGCGMHIEHFKDGTVRISARLIDSPAGRAGIANGAELLEYNGFATQGLGKEVFQERMDELKPREVGDEVRCRVRQDGEEKTVVMAAEMIEGPIPDWSGHGFIPFDEQGDWHQGMAVCRRTGQWIPTARLSDSAIRRIFR